VAPTGVVFFSAILFIQRIAFNSNDLPASVTFASVLAASNSASIGNGSLALWQLQQHGALRHPA